jgi:6-phosphofructokinase 1
MKIGVLTGGGDCPGLNAAIRAIVRYGIRTFNHEIVGILRGWQGIVEGSFEPLNLNSVSGILNTGGTILKSSRTNPYKIDGGVERVLENIEKEKLDGFIPIGGDDTLGVAGKLYREHKIPVVGIPKTIDNDVMGTDYTIGFFSSVHVVTEAIDKLRTTADSHDRVMIIEVMGRHAGWLATYAGICSGADYILIPEVPFDLDKLTESLKKRKDRGRHFSLVVVAEGATFKDEIVTKTEKIDAFGNIYLGGIGEFIEEKLKERFDIPVRSITLGHLQRGGSPTPYDRLLGTRFGYKAMELISNGEFGKMVAIDGDDIVARDIEVVLEGTRTVNLELYEMSKIFFD